MTTTPIIHINTPMITFLPYINYANPALFKSSNFKSFNTLNVNIYTLVLNPIILFLMSFKGILRTWEKSINVHV